MKKSTKYFLKSIIFAVAITAMTNLATGQSNQTVCAGQSATLTATGGTSYNWSTGDTTATTVVTPANTTEYWVTVTQSGNTTLDSVTVTVNQNPIAGISGSNTMNYGSSDTLTATGGTSFFWNTGDTTASVIISPSNTTNYIVTVTNLGCTAESGVTVTVNNIPPPIQTKFKICNGQSVALTAPLGTAYLWSTGDSTQTAIVSPDSAKTYLVTVTLQDSTSVIDSFMVYIRPIPVVYAGNDTVSPGVGAPVTLTATDSTATNATFHWSYFSASGKKINIKQPGSANGAVVTVKPKITTTYFVTVKTKAGCTATSNVTVYVNDIKSSTIFIGQDSVGHSTISTIPDSTLYIQSARTASTDTARNTIINSNNAGRVGIGTNNPTEKLTVAGNARINGDLIVNGNLNLDSSTVSLKKLNAQKISVSRIISNDSLIYFGDSTIVLDSYNEDIYNDGHGTFYKGIGLGKAARSSGLNAVSIGYISYANGASSIAIGNHVYTYGINSIVIGGGTNAAPLTNNIANSLMVGFLSDVPTLYVGPGNGTSGSIGNVGIGTSSPEANLHIVGNTNAKLIVESATTGSTNLITIGNTNSYLSTLLLQSDVGWTNLSLSTDGATYFNQYVALTSTTYPSVMCFRNGNVGIGLNMALNPNNYKLAVKGTIGAQGVYVENTSVTWSDNVFYKDYNLLSFLELEKFINKNKHLPEVPTANEVKEKGIDLVEMDATLLKKIEELTLYIIELKKENEQLYKRISKIENK